MIVEYKKVHLTQRLAWMKSRADVYCVIEREVDMRKVKRVCAQNFCLSLVAVMLSLASGPVIAEALLTEGGNYFIQYQSRPSTIPLNQPFELLVEIRGRYQKQLAKYVDLVVDAGMPQHNHGMNLAPVTEALGDGRFRIRGMLMHMPGNWVLSFVVQRGLIREKAEHLVTVQ